MTRLFFHPVPYQNDSLFNYRLFILLLLTFLQITLFNNSQKSESSKTPAPVSAEADSLRAVALFTALEDSLLSAASFSADFQITSHGAIVSSLQGNVTVLSEKSGIIQAAGAFSGREIDLFLNSDGNNMHYGNSTKDNLLPAPVKLNESILVGFTRMGFLHNLAMLAFGEPPDKTDGSIRQWVTCSGFHTVQHNEDKNTTGVRFQINVNTKPVGEAQLWLDNQTGLPVRREQTVHFEEGDMQVEEIYMQVDIK